MDELREFMDLREFRDELDRIESQPLSSVHYSSASAEHYTPKHILDRVVACLGYIDLDPCADPGKSVPAKRHFTAEDNGLNQVWNAETLFMNSPYGRIINVWINKLTIEVESGRTKQAIALVPARTDTRWWTALSSWPVCFIRGRLKFGDALNSAPFPSAIIYLGTKNNLFVKNFSDLGQIYLPHAIDISKWKG